MTPARRRPPLPSRECNKEQEVAMTDTFLPPIEQPDGLIKRLAYYFTRSPG